MSHRDADDVLNVSRGGQVSAAIAGSGGQHQAAGGQQAVHVLGRQPALHAARHEPVPKGVRLRPQAGNGQAVPRVLQ